jgi:hypothetical protein
MPDQPEPQEIIEQQKERIKKELEEPFKKLLEHPLLKNMFGKELAHYNNESVEMKILEGGVIWIKCKNKEIEKDIIEQLK